LFPNAVSGVGGTLKTHPLLSFAIGLALLLSWPLLAILFIVSLIGFPIGFGLLAFYPFVFILGYLAAASFIGRKTADILNQPKDASVARQIFFLAIALFLLAAVSMIPVVGKLAVFLILVAGIGAWAVSLHGRYRRAPASNQEDVEV
jgi:hypothetical protein